MDATAFTYWLRGWSEIAGEQTVPNPTQWQIIMDHLNTVFTKVTPERRAPMATPIGGQTRYCASTTSAERLYEVLRPTPGMPYPATGCGTSGTATVFDATATRHDMLNLLPWRDHTDLNGDVVTLFSSTRTC